MRRLHGNQLTFIGSIMIVFRAWTSPALEFRSGLGCRDIQAKAAVDGDTATRRCQSVNTVGNIVRVQQNKKRRKHDKLPKRGQTIPITSKRKDAQHFARRKINLVIVIQIFFGASLLLFDCPIVTSV